MSKSVQRQGVTVKVGPFRNVEDLIILVVLRWSGNGKVTIFVDPSLKESAPEVFEYAQGYAQKLRAMAKSVRKEAPRKVRKRTWNWKGTAIIHCFGLETPPIVASNDPRAETYAKLVVQLPSSDRRDWNIGTVSSALDKKMGERGRIHFGLPKLMKRKIKALTELPYGLIDT